MPARAFSLSDLSGGDQRIKLQEVLRKTFGGNDALVSRLLELSAAGKCERLRKKAGEFLYRKGDESTAIYVLLAGEASRILSLDYYKEVHLHAGDLIGDFSLLSGQDQPNDVRCVTRCSFLVIPKSVLLLLTEENRLVLLEFVRPMIATIASHLQGLEYAYEYFLLRSGEPLLQPGDPADAFYFLINGRLREHRVNDKGIQVVREYASAGSTIGISRLLLGAPHTTHTIAVRDTELVKLEKKWLTQLMATNPTGAQALIKTSLMHEEKHSEVPADAVQAANRKRLIAVVPLHADAPIQGFVMNLAKVLRQSQRSVKVVTEELILRRFGKIRNVTLMANERSNIWYYLSEIEKKHDFVICLAKPNLSPWTRWLLQQVDTVLVLAHEALDSTRLSEWEQTLDLYNSPYYLAEKRLVVMHRPGSTIAHTAPLLERRSHGRSPILFVHHLTEGNRFHYQSLARFVAGTAVGVVLGGGGPRGMAHLGAVLALREAGVPIDILGGSSLGAQIGGLLAAEMPLDRIAEALRQTYGWTAGLTRFLDFTFPYLSLLSGRLWVQRIRDHLGLHDRVRHPSSPPLLPSLSPSELKTSQSRSSAFPATSASSRSTCTRTARCGWLRAPRPRCPSSSLP